MLTIDKKQNGSSLTVTLAGKLNTNTAPELEAELKNSLDGITELVFDIKDVEYITSAGLRVLLATHNVMTKQGEMRLRNVSDSIMKVLDMTGFSDWMTYE